MEITSTRDGKGSVVVFACEDFAAPFVVSRSRVETVVVIRTVVNAEVEGAPEDLFVVFPMFRKVPSATEATEGSFVSTREGKGSVVVSVECAVLVIFTVAGKSAVRTLETSVVDFIIEETVSKRGEKGSVAALESVASVEPSVLPKFRETPSVALSIVEDTVAVFPEVVALLASVEVDLTKDSEVLAVLVPGSTVDLVTLVVCVISLSTEVPLLKVILVVLDSSDAN